MPSRLQSSRDELLLLHRAIVSRLRQEIYSSFEAPTGDNAAYQREYERSVGNGSARAVTKEFFFSRLERADLVFQGEFHTLRECQKATLSIVAELHRRRPVVILTEVAPVTGQRPLDAYLAGELEEEAFLKAIRYDSSWGFSWSNYQPIFQFARENEIQIYGINIPSVQGNIRLRDDLSADVIALARLAHPGSIVYTIAGDFRVCREHLPRAVEARLAREGARFQSVLLHQNVDSFYWGLARRRREGGWPVLELKRDEYCILSSNPLSKYQSYLHWELGQVELPSAGDALNGGPQGLAVKDSVAQLVCSIAGFLGVDAAGFDDFRVYTTRDLDFLEDLRSEHRFTEREIGEIKRQISNDESYFISRGNIIYLSCLSVDHASEEAAHYLNNKLSGHVPRPLPARSDFYSRILREALGFFGSKVVNPGRAHHGEQEFREILTQVGRRQMSPSVRQIVKLSRFVLEHLDLERRCHRTGRRPRSEAMYGQDLDLHLGIAHSLGYILGEKLFRGIAEGALDRSEVKDLFCLPLTGLGDAEVIYFDLTRRLGT
jgi:hypothetical protein